MNSYYYNYCKSLRIFTNNENWCERQHISRLAFSNRVYFGKELLLFMTIFQFNVNLLPRGAGPDFAWLFFNQIILCPINDRQLFILFSRQKVRVAHIFSVTFHIWLTWREWTYGRSYGDVITKIPAIDG